MKCINFCLYILFIQLSILGQQIQTYSNMRLGGCEKIAMKIIAHTDSSVFFLGQKKNNENQLDLYLSKHSVTSNVVNFDTCLNIRKVFKGDFNLNNIEFHFYQNKQNIILLFNAVNSSGKILFAKTIDFNGKSSDIYVLDKTEYTNENLESCFYTFYETSKGNVLVMCERDYKSGFKRDKCFLIEPKLNILWEYELPKLNSKTQENVIVDVDNLNQLIYYPANIERVTYFNKNYQKITQKVYLRNPKRLDDIIIKKKIENFDYSLNLKQDSIDLHFYNPINKEDKKKSFYYPYTSFPTIKSITSNQLLMYSMLNLDDKSFIAPSKKAMHYKRFDMKNNTIMLDTLVTFNEKNQQKLMYRYDEGKSPTNKYFKLTNESIVNGNLISVYEHFYNEQLLEVAVCKFNLTSNKPDWIQILPRKINFYYPNMYDFVIRSYNNKVSVSYFEHMKNSSKNLINYTFDNHKLLRKQKDRIFTTYRISDNGDVTKIANQFIDDKFMFPWLFDNNGLSSNFSFIKQSFLPLQYLCH